MNELKTLSLAEKVFKNGIPDLSMGGRSVEFTIVNLTGIPLTYCNGKIDHGKIEVGANVKTPKGVSFPFQLSRTDLETIADEQAETDNVFVASSDGNSVGPQGYASWQGGLEGKSYTFTINYCHPYGSSESAYYFYMTCLDYEGDNPVQLNVGRLYMTPNVPSGHDQKVIITIELDNQSKS